MLFNRRSTCILEMKIYSVNRTNLVWAFKIFVLVGVIISFVCAIYFWTEQKWSETTVNTPTTPKTTSSPPVLDGVKGYLAMDPGVNKYRATKPSVLTTTTVTSTVNLSTPAISNCTTRLYRVKDTPDTEPIQCLDNKKDQLNLTCQDALESEVSKINRTVINCCYIAAMCNNEKYCGSGTAECFFRNNRSPICIGCKRGYGGDRCDVRLPKARVMCKCYENVYAETPPCSDVTFGQRKNCLLATRPGLLCVCDGIREFTGGPDMTSCKRMLR